MLISLDVLQHLCLLSTLPTTYTCKGLVGVVPVALHALVVAQVGVKATVGWGVLFRKHSQMPLQDTEHWELRKDIQASCFYTRSPPVSDKVLHVTD